MHTNYFLIKLITTHYNYPTILEAINLKALKDRFILASLKFRQLFIILNII